MAYNNFNFDTPGYIPSYNFNFGDARKNILAGISSNFTSIWAEPDANIESSVMYVASAGTGAAFSVVDLSQQTLSDFYTITATGAAEEALEREDIEDINVK
jgi:hypothetical protein